MKRSFIALGTTYVVLGLLCGSPALGQIGRTPRIDSVERVQVDPLAQSPAVIWYDDFDGPDKTYTESQGPVDTNHGFGLRGGSMLSHYEKDSRGVGNRKVFFGDSPTGKVVNRGQSYDQIYWRIYVKHQDGWTGGGPAKLSRATSIVSGNWAQAMIAHLWSSGESLTLDPATGVRGDTIVTTRYNDFANLKWLGNKPASQFKLHSTEEAGWWVCVETRAKLNTPGQKDGVNQLWIDGRLEAERTGLDWRGRYAKHGINAVFLETYWNDGSPVTQSRWIDNFVISTEPIGPVVSPRNPVLIKTPFQGQDEQRCWQVEIATDRAGRDVVWKSREIESAQNVRIETATGQFIGTLAGQERLGANTRYLARVREQDSNGRWSDWSPWHQAFGTEE
jgi:hypothetical protein